MTLTYVVVSIVGMTLSYNRNNYVGIRSCASGVMKLAYLFMTTVMLALTDIAVKLTDADMTTGRRA